MNMKMKWSNSMLLIIVPIFALLALLWILFSSQPQISSFEECVAAGFPVMESYPRQCSDGVNTFTENVGLANPASVYCEDQGYTLEIRETPEGQVGYCIGNGNECEEWAFYRGECSLTG
jgi:putative hemolysin